MATTATRLERTSPTSGGCTSGPAPRPRSEWISPIKPAGTDAFGPFFRAAARRPARPSSNYILHQRRHQGPALRPGARSRHRRARGLVLSGHTDADGQYLLPIRPASCTDADLTQAEGALADREHAGLAHRRRPAASDVRAALRPRRWRCADLRRRSAAVSRSPLRARQRAACTSELSRRSTRTCGTYHAFRIARRRPRHGPGDALQGQARRLERRPPRARCARATGGADPGRPRRPLRHRRRPWRRPGPRSASPTIRGCGHPRRRTSALQSLRRCPTASSPATTAR